MALSDWPEHTSACPELRIGRLDAGAFLVLAILAVLVFRVHVFGQGTFVGDGDRLNSFLNMRLFEVDSLRARQAPTWNESNFMGFAASSLHYMVPGADPVAYLEALVPRQELFRVAGYVSMTLLALAGWSAYLFIRQATADRLTAVVGAALYATAVFTVARITQVDSAFLVLILMPLAMLGVRSVAPGRLTLPFAILGVVFSLLVVSTFLQEAAYAIILVGSYALYRGLRRRSWQPLAIFLAALLVAIVIGLPRIVTVFGEVQGLDRHGAFHPTSPYELLRWFNDGIFGRFPSEARAVGNGGMNLREGLQLHTSILAALLILAGALRYRGPVESFATILLLVVLGQASAPVIGRAAALIILGLLTLAHVLLWALSSLRFEGRSKTCLESPPAEDIDVAFHMLFVALTLAVILLEPINYLFHLAFLQLDFTHSRFSLAGLLPVCTLVAVFLRELLGSAWATASRAHRLVALAVAAPCAGASLWLIDVLSAPPVSRSLGLSSESIRAHLSIDNLVMPGELMKVAWSLVLLVMLLSV
jgi:Bacterial membrane protein YfhO